MAKAAGFRFAQSEGTITFGFAPTSRLHGLEITVRENVPTGVLLASQRGDVARSIELFVRQILAWNVVDDEGEPVEATVEAFGEQVGLEEMGEILQAWIEAKTGVAAPLGVPSRNGAR